MTGLIRSCVVMASYHTKTDVLVAIVAAIAAVIVLVVLRLRGK